MKGRARAVVVVALLAVFGVGVCLLATCLVGCGDSGPPVERAVERSQRKIERIDEKSLVTETLTVAQWAERGAQKGKFKNAEGEYTMVMTMKCAACGATIPQGPTGGQSAAETEELRKGYKCPKCDKLPYAAGE